MDLSKMAPVFLTSLKLINQVNTQSELDIMGQALPCFVHQATKNVLPKSCPYVEYVGKNLCALLR